MNTRSHEPDWHGAAQDLVKSLMQYQQVEDRLRILEKLCHKLGDQLYPALLQILLVAERHGNDASKELLAETLAHAVCMQRLPEGKMNAWGSSEPVSTNPFSAQRSLGPIEFLCCWYAQPSSLTPLPLAAFNTALTGLLSLINACEQGSLEYQNKITSDASDPLTGALTMQTRAAMKTLAISWQRKHSPEQCARDFVDSLGSSSSLQSLNYNPFA